MPRPARPARAVRPRRWMYCSRELGTPICGTGRRGGTGQGDDVGLMERNYGRKETTTCTLLTKQLQTIDIGRLLTLSCEML